MLMHHPVIAEYTFLSNACEIPTKTNHVLEYKMNPNKLKRIPVCSPMKKASKLGTDKRNIPRKE